MSDSRKASTSTISDKLTELQHDLGDQVRATLHVHLTHDLCLEVIVMRGPANQLQSVAERILASRGVKYGRIEIIAEQVGAGSAGPPIRRKATAAKQAKHTHSHGGRPHKH